MAAGIDMAERYPVMHDLGPYACGKLAFTFLREMRVGDPVCASAIEKPDGSHPNPGEPFTCYSCGKLLEIVTASGHAGSREKPERYQ
jgi:hypothetical protein